MGLMLWVKENMVLSQVIVFFFTVSFAKVFADAIVQLRPREAVLAAGSARRKLRRAGSLNLLALPLVGSAVAWLRAEKEDREPWSSRLKIELALTIAIPLLFWWELSRVTSAVTIEMCLAHFLVHSIFLILVIAASALDWFDYVVCDSVSVTGTVMGAILVALVPSVLPGYFFSPSAAPQWVSESHGLIFAWLCFIVWFVASLQPMRWTRGGFKGFWLRTCLLIRRAQIWQNLSFVLASVAGIGALWVKGGESWLALATSLCGVTAAIGLMWILRIGSGIVFGQEALGFGDVLFLGMVGAFLGWQGALITLLLSPFWAFFLVAIRPEREQPFVPSLGLAAVTTMVFWEKIWGHVVPLM